MPKKKATHGGKREGAGPKAQGSGPKKMMSARVSPEVRAYLDTVENMGAIVEAAIRSTPEFKAFEAGKTE